MDGRIGRMGDLPLTCDGSSLQIMDGGVMARDTRRIAVLGFDGVNSVDVVGPIEVFASAGRADFTRGDSYRIAR
jgi:hypothetical protein